VQGLTTAAGLWLVAAIGLAAGAGMYTVSVAATLLGVGALTVVRRLERKDDHVLRRKITLVLDEAPPPLASILAGLAEGGAVVSQVEYEKRIDEQRVQVTFQARFPESAGAGLLEVLESQPGVRRLRIEPVA